MRVLNQLKAAPGQPNRNMVTDFLRAKRWVAGTDGLPEAWALCYVPTTPQAVSALFQEMCDFAQEKRGPE